MLKNIWVAGGELEGGVFFGGLYIVRSMMMMVCTYEIYGNGERKIIVTFHLRGWTGIGFEQRTLRTTVVNKGNVVRLLRHTPSSTSYTSDLLTPKK